MSKVIQRMTVGQLKRFIEGLPDDMPVLVSGYEDGLDDVRDMDVCPVVLGDVRHYMGMHDYCAPETEGAVMCLVMPR